MMTIDEALQKLDLVGAPEPNEERRAYLRKVKAHPPERDPEGFRAVREAYELLKDGTAPSPELAQLLARMQAAESLVLPAAPSAETQAVVAAPTSEPTSPKRRQPPSSSRDRFLRSPCRWTRCSTS